MKRFKIFFLAGVLLFTTSCASILNGKYQKVQVYTPSNESKVYLNDEYVGQGKSHIVKMQRDMKAKEIKVEREGYKPIHKVHCQVKKSPLYILSVVPFGISLYTLLYDIGPKAYNYEKTMSIPKDEKYITREEDQKYLYLSKAAVNIEKDKFKVVSSKSKKIDQKKKAKDKTTNKEEIDIDNTIFTSAINEILENNGFVDTLKSILRNRTNTMYLKAEITELTLYELYPRYYAAGTPKYIKAEPTITWTLLDVYNQEKYQKKIKVTSGEYAINEGFEVDEQINNSLEDAIDNSMQRFLKTKSVTEFLVKTEHEELAFENIQISLPDIKPENIEMAMEASVTIKTKEGHGSGFFITEDGYIITNHHVIAGEEEVTIVLNNAEEIKAKVLRSNESSDLALLKIEKENNRAFLIPDDKNFGVGKEVYCIGTPTSVELGQTVSRGIISGVRKVEENTWIQTDVSVNFGNSGGPLINPNGELVGVVNSKVVGFGVEGIAFAIPAKDIFELLKLERL
ncbi:MAG: trypsin-like peptidase domain-containing protein [Bacteroidales bacterium]|nr:trypsin-like peptidase domain-containing protein [Bacteroidales bacterium]